MKCKLNKYLNVSGKTWNEGEELIFVKVCVYIMKNKVYVVWSFSTQYRIR